MYQVPFGPAFSPRSRPPPPAIFFSSLSQVEKGGAGERRTAAVSEKPPSLRQRRPRVSPYFSPFPFSLFPPPLHFPFPPLISCPLSFACPLAASVYRALSYHALIAFPSTCFSSSAPPPRPPRHRHHVVARSSTPGSPQQQHHSATSARHPFLLKPPPALSLWAAHDPVSVPQRHLRRSHALRPSLHPPGATSPRRPGPCRCPRSAASPLPSRGPSRACLSPVHP